MGDRTAICVHVPAKEGNKQGIGTGRVREVLLLRLGYYSSVGRIYVKQALQSALEYPANLAGWLLANILQFGIGFATIKFVVEQFGTLKGWDFEELAFLYGLAVLSHGLSVVLFIPTWYLGYLVINGELDIFLLRPLNVLFQFLFMDVNLVGVTDLISGVIIFAYGCIKLNFVWSLPNILSIIAAIIGGTLLRGAIWLIWASRSFWSENRGNFVWHTMQLYDKTTMYPLTIYPRFLQVIFTIMIPLGWITFYPAGAILNKELPFYIPFNVPFLTMLIGIAVFSLSCFIFCRGLKKYESSGT